jgi:hypothetical protein
MEMKDFQRWLTTCRQINEARSNAGDNTDEPRDGVQKKVGPLACEAPLPTYRSAEPASTEQQPGR